MTLLPRPWLRGTPRRDFVGSGHVCRTGGRCSGSDSVRGNPATPPSASDEHREDVDFEDGFAYGSADPAVAASAGRADASKLVSKVTGNERERGRPARVCELEERDRA